MLATGMIYLKIAGMIIGGILCIILLLLCAVLFLPVHYEVQFKYDTLAYIKITGKWFCSMLRCTFVYDELGITIVRLLGIPLYRSDRVKKPKKPKKSKNAKRNPKKEKKEEVIECSNTTETLHKNTSYSRVQRELSFHNENRRNETKGESKKEEKSNKNLLSRIIASCQGKIQRGIIKCKEIWKTIVDTIRNLKAILMRFTENITYYKEIWNQEETKIVLHLFGQQLCYLYHKVKPKKILCSVEFGAEDPATTGEVLAYGNMILPFLGKEIRIIPYFEEEVLRVNGKIKGHIRMISFLRILVVLYRSKELREVIGLLNKKEIKNGRK
ncbi:MAG: DUF2953 domain-containing protein [Eubacteriales bacterium]